MTSYIVEYDLPKERRHKFYRRIRAWLKAEGLEPTQWSTGSVVFTDSKKFALFVWEQARRIGGVSHIYEARRLDKAGMVRT